MKKNLVPLLGIAFVVAIISTGIFYGLFVGKLKSASVPSQSIVVAARNLDRGTALQAADVCKMVAGIHMKLFLAFTTLAILTLAQAPPISNGPTIVPRPPGAQIKVPAGFSVDEYAAGFARPRFMVEGPGGEVLVSSLGQ